MRTTDIIRRAGRNLRQAKGRTILTSLAIGVGAFTIALAMAAGNGGRSYLDSMVGALGSMRNINVTAKQEAQQNDDKPKKVSEAGNTQSVNTMGFRELTPADRTKIEKIDGVEKVMPTFSLSTNSVQANGSDEYVAEVQAQSDDSSIELTAGKLGGEYEIKAGQVVLPHVYLESFGFTSAEAALNQKVTMKFSAADGSVFSRDFTIVAVDKKPTSPLAFYMNQFRISNSDGEEIAKAQRPAGASETYFGFMVRTKEGADPKAVKEAINSAGQYEAQTFADLRASVMQVVNIVQYGLMGFGLLAIIASVFGIINTQYISVLERTQQIGLMKALGMRGKDVSRLFRYEAAWIGFLGGAIGVLLAFLITLLNPVINNVLHLEDGTHLLEMDWLMSAALIAGLMLVAIISGWFPSRKAARLDPIEALRTE
jgi:putative ABC transport system permease protein